jgi:hypothetical protein
MREAEKSALIQIKVVPNASKKADRPRPDARVDSGQCRVRDLLQY